MIHSFRRTTLFSALIVLSHSVLTFVESELADCSSTSRSSVDIVIVGAGMAGLKAAQTIEAYSDKSYVLLEGQKRVGGRMRKHDDFSGYTIEDGANWIEGANENPINELAEKYGLVRYPQSFSDMDSYYYDGKPIDPQYIKDRTDDYLVAFDCLNGMAEDSWEDFCRRRLRRMQKLYDPGAREVLTDCGWTPEDEVDDTIDWQFIDFEFAMTPDRTSIYSFPEETFSDFGESRFLVIDQRGFEHIAARFAEEELQNSPVVGAEVTKIEWKNGRNDAPARVHTALSDRTCHVYDALKVICTVSIGVLEKRAKLFKPKLDLQNNVYTMATYQKVFFNFTEKFWNDDHDFINVALPRNQRGECGFWQSLDKGELQEREGSSEEGILKAPRRSQERSKGIMFDVVASEDMTITALDVHSISTKKNRIYVFTKKGMSEGYENNRRAWTSVYSGRVKNQGRGTFTRLHIRSVTVKKGARRAFYVTFNDKKQRKWKAVAGASGEGVGSGIAANPDLTLLEGMRIPSLWNKQVGTPKPMRFSGAVIYQRVVKKGGAAERDNIFKKVEGATDIMPGSKILFCTITTDALEKIGPLTKKKAEKFLQPLKAIFKDKYREHDQIYIPEWKNDKWTRGSYEHWGTGMSPSMFYSFFDPRKDDVGREVIILGGSAACLRYWGFVHGAYFSGEMTAFMALEQLGVKDKRILDRWDHICNQ